MNSGLVTASVLSVLPETENSKYRWGFKLLMPFSYSHGEYAIELKRKMNTGNKIRLVIILSALAYRLMLKLSERVGISG